MLKKLTYKRKSGLLAAVIIVFLLISYNLTFRKTIDLITQCSDFATQLLMVESAPLKIANLEARLKETDRLINENSDKADFQESLLATISTFCREQQVILREFPEAHKCAQRDFTIETSIAVIEGPFIKLLKLIYSLEQEFRTGKVASVGYVAAKDLKTGTIKLTVSIYVQNLKKIKNEATGKL